MPPAIERTIYTEEELLSNDEILNEPPPPYSEYPLVTNSVVQNRHQAVNSSNNYGQQIFTVEFILRDSLDADEG
ncbi:1578_t:CDS:2 [Entrophospora sp. SA101]|nr:1578_t:CDS:2 [Entrophospora sp. SA101]